MFFLPNGFFPCFMAVWRKSTFLHGKVVGFSKFSLRRLQTAFAGAGNTKQVMYLTKKSPISHSLTVNFCKVIQIKVLTKPGNIFIVFEQAVTCDENELEEIFWGNLAAYIVDCVKS